MSLMQSLLFTLSPETAHNFVKTTSKFAPLSLWKKQNRILDDRLKFESHGLSFENPIGLAAGFDKEGTLLNFAESLGFGFSELGSITAKECHGQPRPRIFRLKQDTSLINWMGLPNPGAKKFVENIKKQKVKLPFGINITKTPDFAYTDSKPLQGIDDFLETLAQVHDSGNYLCLNLSCPNSKDPTLFESPKLFQDLAKAVDNFRKSQNIKKPILLKLSPDLAKTELHQTLDIALKYNFDGFVVTNTTATRPQLKTNLSQTLQTKGGLSGKGILEKSNAQLKNVYDVIGNKKLLVGVGGVTDFESLLQKFQNGAQIVQVYTGLVYGGLRFVRDLNSMLIHYCEKHKIKHYSEIINTL